MDFGLKFRTRRNGTIVASIPLAARAATLIVAVLLVASAFARDGESLGAGGTVALVLALLASMYEERWTFDAATRTIRFRFGLLFLAKVRSWPFASVESVSLEAFRKGRAATGDDPAEGGDENLPPPHAGFGPSLKRVFASRRYLRLVLCLSDAENLVVENAAASRAHNLRRDALEIAGLVGVSLNE